MNTLKKLANEVGGKNITAIYTMALVDVAITASVIAIILFFV